MLAEGEGATRRTRRSERRARRLPLSFRDRGHALAGIPQIRADPGYGLQFGAKLVYAFKPPMAKFPRVRFETSGRYSTRRVATVEGDVQLRDVLGFDEYFAVTARYVEDPVFPYFGVPSDRARSPGALGDVENRARVSTGGFSMQLQWPVARVDVPGPWAQIEGALRVVGGVRFHHDRVKAADDSVLVRERAGELGVTNRGSVFTGLVFDSRDDMLSPTRGSLHDVTIEAAGPWMGGNRTFARFNASFRTYVPFKAPSFVMAFRVLVDAAWGDVPLVTLGEFGGVAPTEGIGGDTSGRGFFRRRFVGPSKILTGPEWRWRILELGIRRRRIQLGLVAYTDIGKVFQRTRQFAEDLHVGVGTGLYIALPPTLVLRVEGAVSTEGPAAFLTTGHAF